MAQNSSSNFLIQVFGDPTVDWMSIKSKSIVDRGSYYWYGPALPNINISSQPGGSALVTGLLTKMIRGGARIEGIEIAPRLLDEPKNDSITDSWTVWQPYQNKGEKHTSIRLAEWREYESGKYDFSRHRYSESPDVVIIEDSSLGFSAQEKDWPEALRSKKARAPENIIVKYSKYSGATRNAMIQRIVDHGLGARTTIITSISDLRSCAEKISLSLSWEKIFEETVSAVRSAACPFTGSDSKLLFGQVIVTIGCSGAVLITPDGCSLVFDRTGQEGDFQHRYRGEMMGYNTCFIGALASCLAEARSNAGWQKFVLENLRLSDEKADRKEAALAPWIYAVKEGLYLSRLLHYYGYEKIEAGESKYYLQFPFDLLAGEFWRRSGAPKDGRSEKKAKDPVEVPKRISDIGFYYDRKKRLFDEKKYGKWTILEDSVLVETGEQKRSDSLVAKAVFDCSCRIVRKGPDRVLPDVPLESVNFWRSADRFEIEGVRSVNNAMRDYLQLKRPDKPLCVAVFGPPGSGKSFAIKEIAKNLDIDKEAQITFNLSQFESPEELPTAFHQIRDLHLKGKMPLVFWDEFDTPCQGRKLGWLRYFLAPMQDGIFTERGVTHPIGGGIYVFAGGTKSSFDGFCESGGEEEAAAKKPDFISRLRAFINIKGPNGTPNVIEDKLFMVRRAFLLNNFLELNAGGIKDKDGIRIEDGLINAFLKVTRYRHGARSMSNIIDMSSLADKRKYELSSLPPDHLLKMHVDVDEFMSLTKIGHRENIRIGITGHIGLDPEKLDIINAGVEKAIKLIEEYYPKHSFTVFSPLAVGADRIVARQLLKREGAKLIAVLPMAKDDYINDFGPSDDHHATAENPADAKNIYRGAELRQEFNHWLSFNATEVIVMPPAPTRDEAYQSAGNYIADHSDVLIALWDGQGAQGTGGTGEIVDRALAMLSLPVCHVWAGNFKKDPDRRTDAGGRTGKLRIINFARQSKGKWEER